MNLRIWRTNWLNNSLIVLFHKHVGGGYDEFFNDAISVDVNQHRCCKHMNIHSQVIWCLENKYLHFILSYNVYHWKQIWLPWKTNHTHTHTHAHSHTHMHAHIHHTHTHTHIHTHTHAWIVYTDIYTQAYIYIYIYKHTHTQTQRKRYTHTHTRTHAHMHTHTHTHTHMHGHTQTHTHTCMHEHTQTHTHTQTQYAHRPTDRQTLTPFSETNLLTPSNCTVVARRYQ